MQNYITIGILCCPRWTETVIFTNFGIYWDSHIHLCSLVREKIGIQEWTYGMLFYAKFYIWQRSIGEEFVSMGIF